MGTPSSSTAGGGGNGGAGGGGLVGSAVDGWLGLSVVVSSDCSDLASGSESGETFVLVCDCCEVILHHSKKLKYTGQFRVALVGLECCEDSLVLLPFPLYAHHSLKLLMSEKF